MHSSSSVSLLPLPIRLPVGPCSLVRSTLQGPREQGFDQVVVRGLWRIMPQGKPHGWLPRSPPTPAVSGSGSGWKACGNADHVTECWSLGLVFVCREYVDLKLCKIKCE